MLKINAMLLKVTFLLNIIWTIKAERAVSEQIIEIDHHGKLTHIGEHKPEDHEVYAPSFPSYKYYYKVSDPHTHDFKSQTESRHGDVVKGVYWLIEPTGNKRTVTYYADDKVGFHVTIHNSKKDETLHFPPHDHGNEENSENIEDVDSDIDIRVRPTDGEDYDSQTKIQNEESRREAPTVEMLNKVNLQQDLRGPNGRNHYISREELDESHANIERKMDLQRLLPVLSKLDVKTNSGPIKSQRNRFQPPSGVGERYEDRQLDSLIDMPVRDNVDFNGLQRNHQGLNRESYSENVRNRNYENQRLSFLNERRRPMNQNRHNVPQALINRLINHIQGKLQPKPYDILPLRHRDNKPRLIKPGIQNHGHDWEQTNKVAPPNLQKYIRVSAKNGYMYNQMERKMELNNVHHNREDPVKINRRPIVYESYNNPIIHRSRSNVNNEQKNVLSPNRNLNYINNYAHEQYPIPVENEEHYDNLEAYEIGLASDIMKKIQRTKPIFHQKNVISTKSKIEKS